MTGSINKNTEVEIFFGMYSVRDILLVVAISFSIKVIYSIVLAGPANLLVNYLKNLTGIDIYDFPTQFTPFKYVKNNKEVVA